MISSSENIVGHISLQYLSFTKQRGKYKVMIAQLQLEGDVKSDIHYIHRKPSTTFRKYYNYSAINLATN